MPLSLTTPGRLEAEELANDRAIREQQDREYEEALEADRQRERELQAQREAEEAERQKAEELKRQQEEEAERARQELEAEPEQGPDTTSIVLRLPDGSKVQRRFRKDLPLRQLYLFAQLQDIPFDNWNIVTNFPARTYDDLSIDFVAADLHPQGVVFIRERL